MTKRLNQVKRPRPRAIEPFELIDLRAIIAAAQQLEGTYPGGIPRAEFWIAAVRSGYASGLRSGELLAAKLSDLRADGTFSVLQRKSSIWRQGQLDGETLERIRALPRREGDQRWLPWELGAYPFSRQFKQLCVAAGLDRGTFHLVRLSGAALVEKERPGTSGPYLGHQASRALAKAASVSPPTL